MFEICFDEQNTFTLKVYYIS